MILSVRRLLGVAALALALAVPAQAAQQRVNTGTTPGDRTGDLLPAAFGKVNANDAELYATTATLQAQLAALQAISGRLAALQAGTLDGVTIGGTTPAAGSFTTLNVSGGITGTLNGNAATATLATSATKLATARTFGVSGDASCSFTFDGTANAACSLALATTGVTAGTYGSASLIPVVTVDAKGRVTGISTVGNSGGSGAVPATRQILTSGLATGGGDLSADRTITVPKASAAMASAGTDDASAVTPLALATPLATKAPLASPAFTGAPTATTPPAADNSTRIPTTAFLTGAVPRGDLAQSLASGVQDQIRVNLSGPAPSAPSTSATLVAADIDRPLFPTGSPTLTVPNGGAGWRSGPILNNNVTAGNVVLAVPASATLDGITNGTTTLLPKQRARLVQTGAAAYVTDWLDRSPILIAATLTSAVTQADYLLPQGYASYEIALACQVSSGGAGVGLRFSSDGGSTFKAGASDYVTNLLYVSGSTVSSSSGNLLSYLPLLLNQDAQTTNWASARAVLIQGSGTVQPKVDVLASSGVEGGAAATRAPAFAGYRSGALVVNALRLIVSAGNISAGSTLTVRGVPAQ